MTENNAPMFDPWANRGHNAPGDFGLGNSGDLQGRWDRYANGGPMVESGHGGGGGAGHSPDTGLPSEHFREAPYAPYTYGSGNSVFLAAGQGNHDQFT